jgi:tetratricopeptide (TPR) repeat protein
LNYAEAKIAFDKAIKIDSTFAPIYREYGELELTAKHFESAVENYKKYLFLTDKSLNSQLRYAKFLFYGKQFQESIDIIKQIVAKDSSDYINYRLLGYSSYEIKDYKAGLTAMNKFFSMNPAKILPQDYAYLGKLQVKNKLDSLGVNTITRAIALDTTSRDLYGDLSDAYYSMKKYKLSAETYELKLLNTKPNAVDYYNLGKKYYYGFEFAKSDSAFANLLVLNAEYKQAYLFRARNNIQLEKKDTLNTSLAKPFYEKFIELTVADPKLDLKKSGKELIEAYKYLGDYNYTVLKDKAAAIGNFQKVIEIDPADKQAKDVMQGLINEPKK